MARHRYEKSPGYYPRPLKPLPKSPCDWGYRTTDRIRQVLGFEEGRIPKDAHGRYKVDGHTIIVKRHKKAAHGRHTSTHRMFLEHGGREVPVGRVHQALCKRNVFRHGKRMRALRARR